MTRRSDEHEWRITLDDNERFRREAARKLARPTHPRPWAHKKKPTLMQRVLRLLGI